MENICHRHTRGIVFSDTDASGWVHFTKILSFAENAEHEFLRSSGIDVFDRSAGGWPRVRIACEYERPLTFQEKIEVCLCLEKIGNGSLTWRFWILKQDGKVAAKGEMVTAKVNESGRPERIPEREREILEALK
ncbi:acyl-CoA thioesterase [Luteolibacter algae]|uniref:Acyl-CoA thioesterase n=1 Tax=Luteolibacter algae TaxID=454151 RepID=A0ABW5D9S0_9BACT